MKNMHRGLRREKKRKIPGVETDSDEVDSVDFSENDYQADRAKDKKAQEDMQKIVDHMGSKRNATIKKLKTISKTKLEGSALTVAENASWGQNSLGLKNWKGDTYEHTFHRLQNISDLHKRTFQEKLRNVPVDVRIVVKGLNKEPIERSKIDNEALIKYF